MFFCDFLKYNGLPVYAMRERVNRYICIYSVYVDKDLLLCYTENATK